jgi:hypothetical protein
LLSRRVMQSRWPADIRMVILADVFQLSGLEALLIPLLGPPRSSYNLVPSVSPSSLETVAHQSIVLFASIFAHASRESPSPINQSLCIALLVFKKSCVRSVFTYMVS